MNKADLPPPPKIKLRPMEGRDFEIMQQMNSPIYRHAMNKALNPLAPATQYTDEEGRELIYQFSIPLARVEQELRQGRKAFRARALQSIQGITKPEADLLIGLIAANFVALLTAAIPAAKLS